MVPKERRNRILDLLGRRGRLSVRELGREFAVSAPTLYKDVEALERERRVETFYGEIRPPGPERHRHDFFDHLKANRARKAHVAHTAAALVASGNTLFLDASTTTFHPCDALKRRDFRELTIGINSLFVPVECLMHPSFRVISLGGIDKRPLIRGDREAIDEELERRGVCPTWTTPWRRTWPGKASCTTGSDSTR